MGKQNLPSSVPNVPTFDVSDLEKKSPEELDALLRQMDEYALQTKAVMQDYDQPEQKP
jgi:hypothetical protein